MWPAATQILLQGPEHKSRVRAFVTHRNGEDIDFLRLVIGGVVCIADGSVVERDRQAHTFQRDSFQPDIEVRILARLKLKAGDPTHKARIPTHKITPIDRLFAEHARLVDLSGTIHPSRRPSHHVRAKTKVVTFESFIAVVVGASFNRLKQSDPNVTRPCQTRNIIVEATVGTF